MFTRISHVGMAVKDLVQVRAFFEEAFGLTSLGMERFGELAFSFVPMEGADLEFLQSTDPDGQMARFIEKRGQGIHHIALETNDIVGDLARLKEKGLQVINEQPYRNAHQDLVAFIHPKSTFGVLIELIEPQRG